MECPNCGVKWVGFTGGNASTINKGRCRVCGAEYVVDLVKLVAEKDNKKIETDTKHA